MIAFVVLSRVQIETVVAATDEDEAILLAEKIASEKIKQAGFGVEVEISEVVAADDWVPTRKTINQPPTENE